MKELQIINISNNLVKEINDKLIKNFTGIIDVTDNPINKIEIKSKIFNENFHYNRNLKDTSLEDEIYYKEKIKIVDLINKTDFMKFESIVVFYKELKKITKKVAFGTELHRVLYELIKLIEVSIIPEVFM